MVYGRQEHSVRSQDEGSEGKTEVACRRGCCAVGKQLRGNQICVQGVSVVCRLENISTEIHVEICVHRGIAANFTKEDKIQIFRIMTAAGKFT
jgi:hypothetical protein